jgi:hypothetical protein
VRIFRAAAASACPARCSTDCAPSADALARSFSNWAFFALAAVCRRSTKPGALVVTSSIFQGRWLDPRIGVASPIISGPACTKSRSTHLFMAKGRSSAPSRASGARCARRPDRCRQLGGGSSRAWPRRRDRLGRLQRLGDRHRSTRAEHCRYIVVRPVHHALLRELEPMVRP